MAEEKKYTAQEAALAVLKKAEEMLKAHKHIGWNKLHNKLEHEGYSKESADKIAGSIKAKVEKTEESAKENMPKHASQENEPEKSDKAFEAKPGHAKDSDPRLASQANPDKNPKENAEGNNEKAGTTPTQVGEDGKNKPGMAEMKGIMKLAKFMGRMEHKKSQKVEAK